MIGVWIVLISFIFLIWIQLDLIKVELKRRNTLQKENNKLLEKQNEILKL